MEECALGEAAHVGSSKRKNCFMWAGAEIYVAEFIEVEGGSG